MRRCSRHSSSSSFLRVRPNMATDAERKVLYEVGSPPQDGLRREDASLVTRAVRPGEHCGPPLDATSRHHPMSPDELMSAAGHFRPGRDQQQAPPCRLYRKNGKQNQGMEFCLDRPNRVDGIAGSVIRQIRTSARSRTPRSHRNRVPRRGCAGCCRPCGSHAARRRTGNSRRDCRCGAARRPSPRSGSAAPPRPRRPGRRSPASTGARRGTAASARDRAPRLLDTARSASRDSATRTCECRAPAPRCR